MKILLPQIIYIFLSMFALGFSAAKHGETYERTYSFWSNLISAAIMFWLLWAGGFFTY